MDFNSDMKEDSIFWKRVIGLFSSCGYDWVEELLKGKNVGAHNDDLAALYYLWGVYSEEKNKGVQETILDKLDTLETLRQRYTFLKFYLRRIEYDIMDGDLTPFFTFVSTYRVTDGEIAEIIKCCVAKEHAELVGKRIQDAL